MQLIDLASRGLFECLAAEELFLDGGGPDVPALMIWRGPGAVVMGKNQNPWKECNLEVIRQKELLLARRVSGGGTVYHDPGNVNFSWVVDRKTYRPDRLHGILRDALRLLGVQAETAPTGGMLVDGYKISGAAYCYRKERVLHHGTLLWDADLPMMRAALSAPRIRLKTHAVSSLPARVRNLSESLSGHALEDVIEVFVKRAEEDFGPRVPGQPGGEALRDRARRLQSVDWIWGQTPRFEVRVDVKNTPLLLEIRHGRVEKIRWRENALEWTERPWFNAGFVPALSEKTGVQAEVLLRALTAAGWVWPA